MELPQTGRKTKNGPVAQLVAHLHGMQGVRGSSPLRSTTRESLRFGGGFRRSRIRRPLADPTAVLALRATSAIRTTSASRRGMPLTLCGSLTLCGPRGAVASLPAAQPRRFAQSQPEAPDATDFVRIADVMRSAGCGGIPRLPRNLGDSRNLSPEVRDATDFVRIADVMRFAGCGGIPPLRVTSAIRAISAQRRGMPLTLCGSLRLCAPPGAAASLPAAQLRRFAQSQPEGAGCH